MRYRQKTDALVKDGSTLSISQNSEGIAKVHGKYALLLARICEPRFHIPMNNGIISRSRYRP
jgi:hypothetical protein